MSALAEMILRVDGALREDDAEALAVEVTAREWRELVRLARAEQPTTAKKPYRWAIIACSASKLDRPAPARDLYIGALFKLSLELAERQADEVLILSAKHGVVSLDQVLEPYDEKLPTEKHRREWWGGIVVSALLRRFGVKNRADMKECEGIGARVLCLAPGSYFNAIGFMYGLRCWARPLMGLGIGEQKAKLKALIDAQVMP